MADELRIPAEIVDKFSAPLKSFRQHLVDTAKQGGDHTETLAKGFGKVEGALQTTARTAQTVLNPALSAVGVTGIGVGVAVAGIAGALRNLSGNLTALGQLSRETGVAADTLRTFGAVAGKFNVDQESVAAGTKSFVANLREFRMHGNETFAWLQSQGRTAEGRSAFQGLAKDLRASTDAGEALKKALVFGEQIKDPTERGIFFQRLFGNADLARVADGHLGKLEDVWKKTTERLPPLDPKAILKAEEFERAVKDLRGSMKSIGTTIASEVLPFASDFTKWIDDIVKDQRGDFMKGLRSGLQDISRELREIDWKGAGESAKEMILATTALVKPLAENVKEIAAAIRSFNQGKVVEGLRHLDGGHGPLARWLAPLPGDEKFVHEEQVDGLRKQIDTAREQGGLQADLLKDLEERGDKDGAKRLREAMEANSRHLRGLEDALRKLTEQGATVSKSSAEGDGPFGGARIQTAAFGGGGFRRFGGLGGGASLPGGGSGLGDVGEQGERDALRERFRQHLKRTVPGYDGGPMVPVAPGTRVPGLENGTRLPGMGASGGSAVGIPDGIEMTDAERNTLGLIMKYESAGRNTMNFEGKRQGLDPNTAKGYTAQGYFQMLNSNWRRLAPGLGIKTSNAMSSTLEEQTRVALALLRERPNAPGGGVRNWSNYNPALRAALARGERAPVGRIPSLTPPSRDAAGDADFFPNGAPRVLKPDSMKDAPGLTMRDAERIRGLREAGARRPDILADGSDERRKAGLDDDEVERRAVRDAAIGFRAISRRAEDRLTAAAGRAGVAAAPKIDGSSVTVNVNKAGAETTASVSTEGPAFRDVQMRRGQTMEKAGGG